MSAWEVPANLLTGVNPSNSSDFNSPEELRFRILMQEAQTAFDNRQWEHAARAYTEADRLHPSQKLKDKLQECREEQQLDTQYQQALNQGLKAPDLPSALGFYRQAQQYRDTKIIQQLLTETERKMEEIAPNHTFVAGANTRKDYTDPLIGEMVYVASGNFEMGSNEGDRDEKPIHTVTVPAFYLGRHEVTQAQW